jgi:hypothetical protein
VLDFGDSGLGDVHRDFFPIGWMGLDGLLHFARFCRATVTPDRM